MLTHMGRGVFYGVSRAVAYCKNESCGLSAISEFLVIKAAAQQRSIAIDRTTVFAARALT